MLSCAETYAEESYLEETVEEQSYDEQVSRKLHCPYFPKTAEVRRVSILLLLQLATFRAMKRRCLKTMTTMMLGKSRGCKSFRMRKPGSTNISYVNTTLLNRGTML